MGTKRKTLFFSNFFLYALTLLFLMLGVRLFYIQVYSHEKYEKLALSQQYRKIPLPSRRGDILTQDGKILARSTQVYSLYAIPKDLKETSLHQCLDLLKFNPIKRKIIIDRAKKKRFRNFLWIQRHLSDRDYAKLKGWIQKNKIAGFGFSREFKRFYPLFHLASHVVGFTDLDGEGLEGVERYFNEFLKGKDGYQYIAVDALGRPLNEKPLKAQMPEHGGNLVLTIDSVIQNYVEEELNRIMLHWQPKATFAVVVDVRNGKVLAMANRPDFDPNHPAQFPTEARRNRLLTDYYEPGSTIKVFTAFGALKAKVVTLEDTFFCHYGRFQFGPRRITDTHGYGDLSVRMIVVKSSNIGMAQIGVKLGDKKVRQNILDFGFGKKTGIELPGEVAGKVTSEKRWSFYSTTSVAMGYEIGVTALQLAMGYSAIANGGYLYRPTLVEKLIWNGKVVGKSRPCCVRRIYNDPQLQKQMLSILQGVVEEGTAKRARLSDYTMGGKTGTARRNAKGRRGYTGKYLASFVAVAPITRPRLVVVVMTDSPKGAMYGGTVSAPAAARIMQKSLHYLGVPPDKGKEKKDEKEKT